MQDAFIDAWATFDPCRDTPSARTLRRTGDLRRAFSAVLQRGDEPTELEVVPTAERGAASAKSPASGTEPIHAR